MKEPMPELTFFCELEAQPLQKLFASPELIPFLQATHATLSLGILDLSRERAELVRGLNEAGVPVTAWLLLPKDQGYWFNLDNYPQAALRYEQFKTWSRENGLRWARIGLDIEPDIRDLQSISKKGLAGIQRLARSALNTRRLANGTRAYRDLIRRIHADGFAVETYQFPFIIDERRAHSSVIQRLAGVVNLPEADREVLMIYSSFMRPWGQGILCSYASQAQGVGIGSTGGGVELEGVLDVRPLNWTELQTDLLLAHRQSPSLYIFSLEGCAEQDFLPLLRDLDWDEPVQVPYAAAQGTDNIRSLVQRGLWLTTRPAWLLFGLALAISGATYAYRKRRNMINLNTNIRG